LKINIVLAHPDDEVFGCPAFIIDNVKKGHEVTCFFMTRIKDQEKWDFRMETCIDARIIMGYKSCHFVKDFIFEDGEYELKDLCNWYNRNNISNCDVLVTHYDKDVNEDHLAVNKVVQIECKGYRPMGPSKIFMCDVLSETDQLLAGSPMPVNYFYEYGSSVAKNVEDAVRCYSSEFNGARNSKAISLRSRLLGTRINSDGFVEGFNVGRIIQKEGFE